jgi:lipopolysaccharide biosynthesis glycosyltransferase
MNVSGNSVAPIQWFLALSDGGATFLHYVEMAKVAIHSAQKFTSLQPHLLYDGNENEFTSWVRKRGVPIIACQSSLRAELAELEVCRKDATIAAAARGMFLRVELPDLADELALDERILYTDCDVLFRRDVAEDFARIPCEYFAVAGEFSPTDYEHMNNGVMWMNLRVLARRNHAFKNYIRENLVRLQNGQWEQVAYREFFRRDGTALWDKLAPELNWKPYWGDNPGAAIVHFHGPKPFERTYVDPMIPALQHLIGGAYLDYCQLWDSFLAEAT